MKPDWKDAPFWANWKYQDEYGDIWWLYDEPWFSDSENRVKTTGMEQYIGRGDGTLEYWEPRP